MAKWSRATTTAFPVGHGAVLLWLFIFVLADMIACLSIGKSSYLAMTILITVLLVGFIVFSLLWGTEEPKNKLQETWEDVKATVFPKQKDLATPIQEWARKSLGSEVALQQWLLSLPAESLQALGEKISDFCHEMDVNLDWVIDPDADVAQNTKANAESIVIDYCKICLKAIGNANTVAAAS